MAIKKLNPQDIAIPQAGGAIERSAMSNSRNEVMTGREGDKSENSREGLEDDNDEIDEDQDQAGEESEDADENSLKN